MCPVDQRITKEEILDKIRAMTERSGGKPPGSARFRKETGLPSFYWEGRYWRNWSEALVEAGYEANEFISGYDLDVLLKHLADLTLDLGHFPSQRERKHAWSSRADFPSSPVFSRRLGRRADQIAALAQWAEGRPGYDRVAEIVQFAQATGNKRSSRHVTRGTDQHPIESLSNSLVPPVVACLTGLANGDLAEAAKSQGSSDEVQFERRVGTAFRILGLDVTPLGQGTGRAADGLARAPQAGFAIIYDAKVRKGGYRLGTEDRKFREYIDRHARDLRAEGARNVYFVVVSSRFQDDDVDRATEVVRLTDANSLVFLEAAALVSMVERRIGSPREFGLSELERFFVATRIVDPETVALVRS